MTEIESRTQDSRRITLLIFGLVGAKILLHLLTNHRYGYHRDELYFLACAEHLAAGYVDHAPGIGWITWFETALFGNSIRAIRILPAFAGGAMLWLTCLICRRLGGGFKAVLLAGLSLLVAPLFLRANGALNIVTFDQFWWVLSVYLVLRTLQTENDKGWLGVGVAIGLGLMTKHTMVFLCFGLTVGILLTPDRRKLLNPYFLSGIAIAFLIFLPNLIWQMTHDWATLDFLRDLNDSRMENISRVEFLLGQVIYLNPFTLPIWVSGLVFFLFSRVGRPYRIFGWTYLAILAVFLILKSKVYYLGPAYPMLFAGGGVAIERFLERRRWRTGAPILVVFLMIGGLLLLPLSAPILPIQGFFQYVSLFQFMLPNAKEVGQDYFEMYGWEEMVEEINRIYDSLDPEEQEKCGILAGNYSQAGAVDRFGPELGLPKAISGHNSYFYWGPGEREIEMLITVGIPLEGLSEYCQNIEEVSPFSPSEPGMGERNVPISICRDFTVSIEEAWPLVRHYN